MLQKEPQTEKGNRVLSMMHESLDRIEALIEKITSLLGNAIVHGVADEPSRVTCADSDGIFCLSVTNGGAEIPLTSRACLFEPFERNADGNRDGLGLGLCIASQIAEAHDGVLAVASNADATTFTFKMPSG